jgi:hypothetical protein
MHGLKRMHLVGRSAWRTGLAGSDYAFCRSWPSLLLHALGQSKTFEELCKLRDWHLFNKVMLNPSHVLHMLLPPKSVASSHYSLRTTRDRRISRRKAHITDFNFINRMLFCDL